jgi:hypothetical protein
MARKIRPGDARALVLLREAKTAEARVELLRVRGEQERASASVTAAATNRRAAQRAAAAAVAAGHVIDVDAMLFSGRHFQRLRAVEQASIKTERAAAARVDGQQQCVQRELAELEAARQIHADARRHAARAQEKRADQRIAEAAAFKHWSAA